MARILQLTPLYSPFLGGVEENVRTLLKFSHHEHIVLTDLLPNTPKNERALNNSIIRVGPSRTAVSNEMNPYDLMLDVLRESMKALLLTKMDFDILHVRACQVMPRIFILWDQLLGRTFWKYVAAWRMCEKPILVTYHTLPSHSYPASREFLAPPFPSQRSRRSWIGFEKNVADYSEAMICVDQYMIDALREMHFDSHAQWIPSGIDCKGLMSAGESNPTSLDALLGAKLSEFRSIILFVGRLGIENGFSELFRLAKMLASDELLVVVGTGSRTDFPSSAHVVTIGPRPPELVASLMRRATCVFNPVLVNGVSRVTWEALALGTPVVMISRGHDRRPLRGDRDILLTGSAREALSAIRELVRDEGLRASLSRNGQKSAEESDLRQIAPLMDRLYESLI